ncbi:hypothetical protein D3C76_1248750 [compost metagenome]
MADGGAHVRIAELGEYRAVHIVHQRMDHALRVDHHLDLGRLGIEQPAGLNQFQALVHHACRVHGDLSPHGPIGMSASLLG